MNSKELKEYIVSDDFNSVIKDLYLLDENDEIEKKRERYIKILDSAVELYGDGDYHFISSPGRTEICGNHTDHQNGVVVAAALNIDNLCIVKRSDDNIANFCDEVFGMNEVDLNDLQMHEDEKNNTKSIIRGVAARLNEKGLKYGGFKAYQDMNVLVGSGISSSACFEVLIVEIYNYLYNEDKIDDVERAIISQWTENNYFGKPCGLMDQTAVSVGSFVNIDFKDKEKPVIKKYDFNFSEYGYDLLIVNTKANHADLTDEYAAIPYEMKEIAKFCSKNVLSEVNEKEYYDKIKNIREKIKNDRAVLRAFHFFNENERAKAFALALEKKDIETIISIMKESARSSYMYLQNVYASSDPYNQGVSVALAMSEKIIGDDGVCRVHGGGFAGTIQVIVKKDKTEEYISKISKIFGDDAVMNVKIRPSGTREVI